LALFNLGKKKETKEFPTFKFSEESSLPPLPPKTSFPKFPEVAKEGSRLEPLEIPVRRPPMIHEKDVEKKIPLFVKINKYKAVVSSLHHIKEKVQEAENVLHKLDIIKAEEDRELNSWHESVSEIKERLLDIDEKLFEID